MSSQVDSSRVSVHIDDILGKSTKPRQARIHTCFHRFTEIGQIFYNKSIFFFKFQVKIERWT